MSYLLNHQLGSVFTPVSISSTVHAPNLATLDCNSTSSILNCSVRTLTNCSLLAGLTCQPKCSEGDVRLVGGTSLEGTVELCRSDGAYYTVCNTPWCDANTLVVCSQLGHSIEGWYTNQHYMQGLHSLYSAWQYNHVCYFFRCFNDRD